jgi:hypothetical protein
MARNDIGHLVVTGAIDGMDLTGKSGVFMSQADTPAAPVFESGAPSYSRVPNNLLSKLLDHGKVSAYAGHPLAIKCSKGRLFPLNVRCLIRKSRSPSLLRLSQSLIYQQTDKITKV